jgi:hypothetical protein
MESSGARKYPFPAPEKKRGDLKPVVKIVFREKVLLINGLTYRETFSW